MRAWGSSTGPDTALSQSIVVDSALLRPSLSTYNHCMLTNLGSYINLPNFSLALQQEWVDSRVQQWLRGLVDLSCSPLPVGLIDLFFVWERFIEHHRCLLSSPEGRAVCRPSALAALTCLGPAAPVAPTQPGIRMTTTLMTFQSSTSFWETREFMTGMSIGATMGVTGGGEDSRVTEAWKKMVVIRSLKTGFNEPFKWR